MAVSFENTTRALSADGARGGSWLLLGLCLLLLAWGGWFVLARVPVYQVADVAALEGIAAAHPVAAEVEGRVASARLELGRAVVAGEVLVGLERYGEAEALYREALRAFHAAFGPGHTDIAVLHNNLGPLLRETGRPAEAEVSYREALRLRQRLLGADHPQYALTLANLGVLLRETGREDEGEACLARALPILEAGYGAKHPHTVACREAAAAMTPRSTAPYTIP